MKLVVLDSYALQEGDLDWSGLAALAGPVTTWPRTPYEQAAARIADAELVVVNKTWIDDDVLSACPHVKWIGLTATGTDSLDLAACTRHGVPVANVPGYSTESVAQMVFSLLLSVCQCPERYWQAVQGGCWQTDIRPEYGITPQRELFGKTIGIVGYGSIGRAVARMAKGFGMQVLVHTRTVRAQHAADGVQFVPLRDLLAQSDIVSLHCPATPDTRGLIGAEELLQMKRGAILVNTARGALVQDDAVAAALQAGHLGFFAADVVGAEPIAPENPLLHCPGVLLTPHIAWATQESLARLSAAVAENLQSFLCGAPQNIVNPLVGRF